MYTSALIVILIQTLPSSSVTVNRLSETINITPEEKIDLVPILVQCQLTDFIILSSPLINSSQSLYFLYKPNGDALKLNLSISHTSMTSNRDKYPLPSDEYEDNLEIIRKNGTVIIASSIYKIFNLNNYSRVLDSVSKDSRHSLPSFEDYVKNFSANNYVIGPLGLDDHGNWVLSLYYKARNGNWIEAFQVITVEITEIIPAHLPKLRLQLGDSLEMMFGHPIKHLESCQLKVPDTAFDRYYDRIGQPDLCGYVVTNVTKKDAGVWQIYAVGKIVYRTSIHVNVSDYKAKRGSLGYNYSLVN